MRALESGVLAPAWAGTEAGPLLQDEAVLEAMLRTEVALAQAQAELGMIPQAAAQSIHTVASRSRIDAQAVADGVRATANPVVAFVAQFTTMVRQVDPAAAEYVHRGSTSQDILDTALMLLAADSLEQIGRDLTEVAHALAVLVGRHRDTPMAGRTLTQHAVPVTFGLKAAGWLDLVLDALERVRRCRSTLPASIGGAAGTLAAYHEYAQTGAVAGNVLDPGEMAARTGRLPALVARNLGLAEQSLPWHGARTPLADVASALLVTTGALGKIAADVLVLSRTEIGELSEEQAPGRGVSSAMPHKHNPVYSTLVAAAARQAPPLALVLFQSMVAEDERSSGAWHAEWLPLRECLRTAMGAASNGVRLTASLRVNPDAMSANLQLTQGAIVTERLNVVLAPRLGKGPAKHLLTRASTRAEREKSDLLTVLTAELAGAGVDDMDACELAGLLDPAAYTGLSAHLADRVLARLDIVLRSPS